MEQLKHILFIDIETVPCVPEFNSLSEALQLEWKKKAKYLKSSSGDLAEPDQKSSPDLRFCGHNIKEFDIPFLCRRMVINGMELPSCMQLSGKKPWDITHIDTLELWRFGDYKHFTSLALLAAVLDIPSPKGDIDGSMVGTVYWKDKDLARIAKYCLGDVLTTARVFLRLKGYHGINPEPNIVND